MVRRTRDPAWTAAFADVLGRACAGSLEGVRPADSLIEFWAQALALLPEAAWEARVGAVIRARRFEVVPALLAHGPGRFSEGFSAGLGATAARAMPRSTGTAPSGRTCATTNRITAPSSRRPASGTVAAAGAASRR